MPDLSCCICIDAISIQTEPVPQPHGSAQQRPHQEEEHEDFLTATPCGHMFHNNCLQFWFREEETNDRNTLGPLLFLLTGDEDGLIGTRLYRHSCPYCKKIIFAKDCIKLYPFSVTSDAEIAHTAELKKYQKKLERTEQKYTEVKRKFDELSECHNEANEAFATEVEELNKKIKDTENEHEEVEEKWIAAMRRLDTDHKNSKAFFLAILESIGYEIPAGSYPDLSIADLIAQVLENREIVDQPDSRPQGPIPSNSTHSSSRPADSDGITPGNNETTGSNVEPMQHKVKLGDRVVWNCCYNFDNPVGTVKWIGGEKHYVQAGIEFDKPIGNIETLIRSLQPLFPSKVGHARLVPVGELVLFKDFSPPRNGTMKNVRFSVTAEQPNNASNATGNPLSPDTGIHRQTIVNEGNPRPEVEKAVTVIANNERETPTGQKIKKSKKSRGILSRILGRN